MKRLAILLMALLLHGQATGRVKTAWMHDELRDRAELIVVAVPTSVVYTEEEEELTGFAKRTPDGKPDPVMATVVETTFNVLTTLKGDTTLKSFQLRHCWMEPPKREPTACCGPSLISFKPSDRKTYLLFLQRDARGNYVPVAGQTDLSDSVWLVGSSLLPPNNSVDR